MAKVGAPTTYTYEMSEKICAAVVQSDRGLQHICATNEGFPDAATVYDWRFRDPEFDDRYLKAKRFQAQRRAEELNELGETARKFAYTDKDGILRLDSGILGSYKLDADNFKWTSARLAPMLFGDKKTLDINDVTPTHEERLKHLNSDDVV